MEEETDENEVIDAEIIVTTYINFKLQVKIDEDIITWWEGYKNYFPQIYLVAQKYLTVQCSSAESERVFSFSGALLSKKRIMTLHDRVNKICKIHFYHKKS